MLSKIIGSLVVMGLLAVSPAANAHATSIGVTVSPGPIVISWTWVAGHWDHRSYVRAHWVHPAHGKSYRAHRHGPPPAHVHAARPKPPRDHKHRPRHYRPRR